MYCPPKYTFRFHIKKTTTLWSSKIRCIVKDCTRCSQPPFYQFKTIWWPLVTFQMFRSSHTVISSHKVSCKEPVFHKKYISASTLMLFFPPFYSTNHLMTFGISGPIYLTLCRKTINTRNISLIWGENDFLSMKLPVYAAR